MDPGAQTLPLRTSLRSSLTLLLSLLIWSLAAPGFVVFAQQTLPMTGQGINPLTGNVTTEYTPVYLSVTMEKLDKVDETEYSFTAVLLVRTSWEDPRLDNFTDAIFKTVPQLYSNEQNQLNNECAKAITSEETDTPTNTTACVRAVAKSNFVPCNRYCDGDLNNYQCCDSIWLPSIEIGNILDFPVGRYVADTIKPSNYDDGSGYVVRTSRLQGTFSSGFNFHAFPYDSQVLKVIFEMKAENAYLVRSRSGRMTAASLAIQGAGGASFTSDEVTGWDVKDIKMECTASHHPKLKSVSDYDPADPIVNGYLQEPEDNHDYNRTCTYSISIRRLPDPYTWLIIFPIVLNVLLSFAVFLCLPDAIEVRLVTVVTMFLSLVAIQFVVYDQIPKTSYLTDFQIFVLFSYAIEVACAIETVGVYFLTAHMEKMVELEEHRQEERLKGKAEMNQEGEEEGHEGQERAPGHVRRQSLPRHLASLADVYSEKRKRLITKGLTTAVIIDRISFVVFTSGYVIAMVVIFSS